MSVKITVGQLREIIRHVLKKHSEKKELQDEVDRPDDAYAYIGMQPDVMVQAMAGASADGSAGSVVASSPEEPIEDIEQ